MDINMRNGVSRMKTILFVDDDESVRTSYKEILRRFGYMVIACADGLSAMQQMRAGPSIDLAIVDMVMPGMNGLDVIEGILRQYPGLPCILLTGNATIESYAKAKSLGIYEHLNKPIKRKELKEVLTAALAWGEEQQQRTTGREEIRTATYGK